MIMFADDTTALSQGKNIHSVTNDIQENLDVINTLK